MKKLILAAAALFAGVALNAADKSEIKKEGWGFGALPAVSFSSDLGFQYGAFGDFYYYGKGDESTYPNYRRKIGWEISHYTGGRTRFFLSYDQKNILPGIRFNGSVTYILDPLYSFYGFNGSASPFISELNSNKEYAPAGLGDAAIHALMGVNPLKKSISYYGMNRNQLRILADLQGNVTPQLRWAAGVALWGNTIGSIDEKYGYDLEASMYNHYKAFGLIKESEANGGYRAEVKAGVVYDTRNFEAAPNSGVWSEIYFNGSPDLFGDGFNYLKLSAHWRHYITIPLGFIKAGDPVFAYHLAYQGTIVGETPFYMQQNISTLILKQMVSEGLGSSNTLRGTMANRLIGDGYAWGNFELRVRMVDFRFLNQNFYVAANPFFDCGAIVQPYRLEEMSQLPEIIALAKIDGYNDVTKYLKAKTGEFIYTAGCGLKVGWNENFIVSLECAHNFNKGIGNPFWISIGTNYAF